MKCRSYAALLASEENKFRELANQSGTIAELSPISTHSAVDLLSTITKKKRHLVKLFLLSDCYNILYRTAA